jgi:uncharacterized membrane protein
VLDGALHDALINWGSFFANHAVVRTLVTFVHVGAILGAGGAAVTADRGILAAWRLDDHARLQQLVALRQTHRIVVAGLACIGVSGLLLFASDVDSFLYSKMFWTKMSLVALLLVNGAVLVSAEDRASRGAPEAWRTLHVTAFASVALWFLVTLAGVALLNIG